MRKHTSLMCLLISLILFATLSETPALAESSVVPVQPELDQAIEAYIQSHPEVIEKALRSLEAKRREDQKSRIKQAIQRHQNQLLHDPDSPVSGNPAGDITVVEFFDYRCGYCKRSAGAVTQLQREDSDVRVVYKDFPILGDASVFSSRAALAAQAQGKHQAFHEALLASDHDLTKEEVWSIAERTGLDRTRLEHDMFVPKWDDMIKRNLALAESISISGTPGFIIGGELYLGALELEGLKQLVVRARGLLTTPDTYK